MRSYTAFIEWNPQTRLYVGVVAGMPGAQAQAANLEELKGNLVEACERCLDKYRDEPDRLPTFLGLQKIELPF